MAVTNPAAKEEISKFEARVQKTIDHFSTELTTVRAGRANPNVLSKIYVDYYGVSTPLANMANISVPEARQLMISLWDVSQLKNVVKAIQASDLGINPVDDGKVIRLNFPQLTEERRRDLVKQVKKMCEDYKITLRNDRRDAIEVLKKLKKDASLSEDELELCEKEVQKYLDKSIEQLEKTLKSKEQEILEV